MITRRRELVATEEPTVVAKPLPDAIVMEDRQSDRGLPDTRYSDESDGCAVFCETNDPVNQFVASKADRRWGRGFPRSAKCKF